ncbi:MAG: dihydroorotase [Dysgonamonadaceae bacterium]|jgi:dihydroorotase|nr:dihydroorotase [Dysgonamonadaceae bacterium]
MILIKNALIINEGCRYKADVLVKGDRIEKIWVKGKGQKTKENPSPFAFHLSPSTSIIDAEGLLLLPGLIDDQVHFREPGLTHKGDIHSESRAALAGGITSFIDMPNTLPQTVTVEALNEKFDVAARASMANYSFMIGGTNDNIDELKREGAKRAAAVKIFMGASTGNMLVDNPQSLERIFSEIDRIIVAHCESETVIAANKARYIAQHGEDLDITFHPKIRDVEACFESSAEAVRLAKKHNSRLHIFHLSTEKELSLLDCEDTTAQKRITAEVCIHHLWFTDEDYPEKGNLIKWNPAVKSRTDRDALRKALIEGKIDIIATDHAPHTLSEKEGSCLKAASGGPMVQHALVALLELCRQGVFTEELVVKKTAHAPAELFGIKDRGFIREGYYADLVLVNPNQPWTVDKENILYKCGWSPLEGTTFTHQVEKTFVNGRLVYDKGKFDEGFRGKELEIY